MRNWALIGVYASILLPSVSQASSLVYHQPTLERARAHDAHTLEVRCNVGENKIKISRISILNVPGAQERKIDLGITTGHGLLGHDGDILKSCQILDFTGDSYDVTRIHVAKDYSPGTASDWAIVAFERAKKTDVIRYALASPLSVDEFDEFAETGLNLMFSSARGVPDGKQVCRVMPRKTVGMNKESYKGLMPHSCKAISGQSGAPLSIMRDNQNIIMGFHVGHAFWIGVPDEIKPVKQGYMRIFDDILVQSINESITTFMEKL